MKFSTVLKLTSAILAASVANAQSLKEAANGFRIGVAATAMRFNNPSYTQALSNFNYMVAENDCKMVGIQPSRGNYDFSKCDNHYNKAKELGMAFRGHCLVWHSMPPQWFEGLRGDDLKNAMVDHITKTLKYYEGKIDTWDVVNEAIDDSSNGPQWKMRPSFLYQNIPDFVDLAFKTARQATSTTKLFYNDYNTEGIYGKSEAVFNFVKDMKSRNIPIDGVGLQYHVSTQSYPKYEAINDLIGRYCQLGLEVHITEMDVKGGGNQEAQSRVYSEALKACLSNKCCTGFLVWGVGDNDSWLGGNESALLFDGNYQPKASYRALLDVLKSSSPGANAAGNSPAPAAPAGGDAGAAPDAGAPTGGDAGSTPDAGAPTGGAPAGGDAGGSPDFGGFGGAPSAAGGAPGGGFDFGGFGGGAPGGGFDFGGGAPGGGFGGFGGGAPGGGFDFGGFGGGAPGGGFGGFGGGAPGGGFDFGGFGGGAPGGFGGFGGFGGGAPGGGFDFGGFGGGAPGGFGGFGGFGGGAPGGGFDFGGFGGGAPGGFGGFGGFGGGAPGGFGGFGGMRKRSETCSQIWEQCGGYGWTGPNCCAQGACVPVTKFFYQCQE